MSQRKKTSRIGLLMIFSELLIAVFVFRWLQSEFNGEKEQLQKNLFAQFMDARSRVMDSVIAKEYINPILGSPNGFKIRTVNIKGDPNIPGKSHMEIYSNDSAIFVDSVKDIPHPHKGNIEVKVTSDTSKDLLYRGVKMFITRVTDRDSSERTFEKHVLPGDTAMLKAFFTQNLKQNNLLVNVMWLFDSSKKDLLPTPFYYESDFLEKPYGALIDNYNEFLFEKILPQIFFSLLLLTITSAAFIFSFRSLRNQLRLAAIKDDFISNMSHELKTPLATMKVAIEAMQQMNPVENRETIQEYLGMSAQELSRLDQMISKVMSSIALENGNDIFHFESVNLKYLVEKTIQSLELQIKQRNARVNFISDADESTIHADALHMQGILYNLFDNSLKYGNESPEISLHLSQNNSEIVLDFRDNGPGIPEEYLDKVFDKFFRVPSGNKHNVKGFGLGLNYVSQVMKQHGGNVSVKNIADAGCEFTLRFPKG